MDLSKAIEKHSEWKVKFRSAISKQEILDAETVSKDDCCELGKWLHGESKLKFGKFTSYMDCVAKHAIFHVEAGKVARTINSRKYAEAEAMLNAGTPYSTASSAVGIAISRLKKEAGL